MKSSSSSRAPCNLVSVTVGSVGHLWSYTSRTLTVSETTRTRPRSGRIPLPRRQTPCTVQWLWMTLPAAGGSRPDGLTEVRPQERVQWRTAEQIILAPMLDVPVPLMEEQLLVDAFAPYDIHVREQVIEVPKILIDELPVRNPCSRAAAVGTAGGSADHLLSSLQRIVEQNVDIPVPPGVCAPSSRFSPRRGFNNVAFSVTHF